MVYNGDAKNSLFRLIYVFFPLAQRVQIIKPQIKTLKFCFAVGHCPLPLRADRAAQPLQALWGDQPPIRCTILLIQALQPNN